MNRIPSSPGAASSPRRIILLGRAPGNDVVVKAPSVSARHARVVVDEEGLWLEDLGSRNGTFVGVPPRRVERERIDVGDTITLGNARLPATALEDLLTRTTAAPPGEGTIELDDAALLTFGRGASADVSLGRPLASALHASVSVERGRVFVRDLGSTHGTFVDGRRIERAVEISPGTVVQIADQRYRLAPDARSLEPLAGGDRDIIEADHVAVEASGRRLLEGVSLVVQPGEMVAIMGPSGAGKSTLLSVLNGQTVPAAGRLVIGGLDLHSHYDLFRGRIGYVPQDDILHADLTVWQALWYAARLRLPRDTTDTEIETRIHAVIHQLGLDGTEKTRVGDQRKRGVSGGQRKRVNLAMELLTDPPILVLDEPTSGLSSVDALSVIELLRKLADSGKTILVTIHQPSLEAFENFDAVAVIARDESTKQVGRLAWFGRAFPDSITFFEPQLSGSAPPTSVDGLLRGLSKRPVAEWVRQWESSVAKSIWVDRRASAHTGAVPPRSRRLPRSTAPFTQWLTLVKRMIAVKVADGWGTAVLFAQAPIVGLLIAAVFSKVVRSTPTPDTWPKIGVNMATTLFVTALAAIWFGCSSMAREIVTEWPIYRRERMVGLSIGAYVASKMTVLLGIAAIQCLLLLAIVAPACRIDSPWLWVFTMLYAAALAGGALGLLISATLRTTEAASGILPVLLLPMIVLGGILVPLADLPALTQPLAAAMPSRWAFEGLVVPEAALRPRIRLGGEPTAPRPEPSPAAVDELEPAPPKNSPTELSPSPVPEGTTPSPDETTGPGIPNAFRLAGNGGGHPFILPGRRKIVEKLEEAAARAKQELERAKKLLEEKAQKIQADMRAEAEQKLADAKAEFEKKSAESAARMKEEIEAKVAEAKAAAQKESAAAADRMKAEMELRVKEAQEEARKESAAARDQVRQEVEAKTADAKAEAQKQSEETAARMRTEIEAKMEEAQVTAKRQSEEAGSAAKADVESRVKTIEAELEKKSREASDRLEGKLREMQEKIESERARMSDSLERVRAATEKTLVPPAGVPAASHGSTFSAASSSAASSSAATSSAATSSSEEALAQPSAAHATTATGGTPPVDMAERFFGRDQWRSPSTVPLAVLLGMFGAGIAGTALALRFRDSSGR
jgi:ABC-type multidrug transport system ATPase subunit/pSer/pThr/pTyr-binding forkhead associated (FHA) protein